MYKLSDLIKELKHYVKQGEITTCPWGLQGEGILDLSFSLHGSMWCPGIEKRPGLGLTSWTWGREEAGAVKLCGAESGSSWDKGQQGAFGHLGL